MTRPIPTWLPMIPLVVAGLQLSACLSEGADEEGSELGGTEREAAEGNVCPSDETDDDDSPYVLAQKAVVEGGQLVEASCGRFSASDALLDQINADAASVGGFTFRAECATLEDGSTQFVVVILVQVSGQQQVPVVYGVIPEGACELQYDRAEVERQLEAIEEELAQ